MRYTTLTGTLDMERVAGGKRLQATTLTLDDGQVVLLDYRPMPQHYALVERRVMAKGRRHMPPPNIQAVSAEHFEVESIWAAPGQEPIRPAPRALPAPPYAQDAATLMARRGRWVRVHVTLAGAARVTDGWYQVNLASPDGTLLSMKVLAHRYESEAWLDLKGQTFTVLGKLSAPSTGLAPELPAPAHQLYGQVCGRPGHECVSNVALDGEGDLPVDLSRPKPPKAAPSP